jgi:hypothetical protein
VATADLTPAGLDFTGVRANDRNLISFTLTSGGNPIDLTGQTLMAQARKKASDADPPVLTAIITITSATAGQFTLRWPGTQVMTALGGTSTGTTSWAGVWDLQMQSGSNDPITICAGAISLDMDVSR